MKRIAINGYGRIGQSVLRALYESGYRNSLQVVAINELAEPETIGYLTRYDSTHGPFRGRVEVQGECLWVEGDAIQLVHEPDPAKLPWKELGIDLVLECTGAFSDRDRAEQHIASGAKRLLFSQPAEADVDLTVVFGVNHGELSPTHRIVSNASCTTNCVIPVIQLLDQVYGVEQGSITTIHSAMNDQPVIDAYHHKDLRRSRSALASMVPVDTGLARGIERILPELAGRLEANAVRVPVVNVSLIDMCLNLATEAEVVAINACLKQAANGKLKEIVGYTEEPLASCDFNHDRRSAVVDGGLTRVSQGRLLKLMLWFDNEWAYANRMLDTAQFWLERCQADD